MRSLLAAGWAAFSIFFVSAAAWPSEPPLPEPGPISVPLSFQEIAKRALPSVEALGVESRLAEPFQLLGAGRGHLREGPTVGIATGPRRGPSATTGDLAVEVELPLALASEPRNRLAAEVASATAALREGAAREARLRLRRAYLDAWLAERILSLRAAELSTVETWLAAARARLAAGADPPFEASLVEGEILGARLALDQAREERTLAWGALR
ncbi:MAG TPA: TolC family protein, partial [Thermoanaerobaculia bacterium]|nr:TolC family protein [Thermoanaerobaculia bacterium]